MGRKNVPVPYHQEWDSKVMAIAGGMTLMKNRKRELVKIHKIDDSLPYHHVHWVE
jgi:hypothetical protein